MEAERPQEEDGEQVSCWGAGLGNQPREKGHVGPSDGWTQETWESLGTPRQEQKHRGNGSLA
jgi:hypothetical protein